MPQTRAQWQAEAEARSSAGGGGGGGGGSGGGGSVTYDKWQHFMMAAAPEDMEGVMEQADKCELGTASCCLFEDRDGKLKHQQDKIDQQKARIEKLEANVKTLEAHLAHWKKYPKEMHASLSSKPARKMEAAGVSGSVKKAKRQAEQIASAAREAYTYTPEYRSIVQAERVLHPDYPDDAGAGN